MADTSMGVCDVLKMFLGSSAAGFVFGEASLFAFQPSLSEDQVLLKASSLAAARTGSTGVGVVTACLVFTSALLSLGNGFVLAALVMKLLTKAGVRLRWLIEATAGAFISVGAVTTGVLAGLLPLWIYTAAQLVLVLFVYSYANINNMTTALLIIFTSLYLSVLYGQMGVIIGGLSMGMTVFVLCALRKTLKESFEQRPQSRTECKLLERIFFYSVFVGILGFFIGLGSGEMSGGSETEVISMLLSIVWVVFLSAGLLGAGLGTVTMVGLGTEAAGNVALGTAIITSLALKALMQWNSSLGARSCTGGALGAAAVAGVSLGAASVGAKQAFRSKNSTFAVLSSVAVSALAALKVIPLKPTLMSLLDVVTVVSVVVGAFAIGAPKSPFHTEVKLRTGLLTGMELIKGIGMETVTSAAAPIGAGALGAAALGTAALGRLGTVGVLAAILLALGSALSGMIGKSPTTLHVHRD